MDREFIKEQIIKLKGAVDNEIKLINTELFDHEAIAKIFSGVHNAGYELFKALYPEKFENLDSESEEKIFAKFNDFMYGREITANNEYVAFDNLCNWFEREL